MVEKTGCGPWPSLDNPLCAFTGRAAECRGPASKAMGSEAACTIAMELPGVAEDDVEFTVDDGVVMRAVGVALEPSVLGQSVGFFLRKCALDWP